jgi:hypothetical protein
VTIAATATARPGRSRPARIFPALIPAAHLAKRGVYFRERRIAAALKSGLLVKSSRLDFLRLSFSSGLLSRSLEL